MKNIKNIVKRSPMEVAIIAVMAVFVGYLGLPAAARATATAFEPDAATKLEIAAMQNETKPFCQLPQAELRAPCEVGQAHVVTGPFELTVIAIADAIQRRFDPAPERDPCVRNSYC